jgi:pimeloyl-ACP methyl ester carboxylesterase
MAEQRRAEVAGTEVTWLEAEPKTQVPVLYLHGVPNSGVMWERFLTATGGIAPDLPGFGESAKAADFDYSIDGYGRFLEAFADHLDLGRFQLVMHDWGAVGLALAQARPEAIERLVLIDAVPFLPGYRWHRIARIWRTPVVGELFQGTATKWASKILLRRMDALREDAVDAFVEETWRYNDHGTQRAILKLYRSAPPDVLARAGANLNAIDAPALVVWGQNDHFLPPRFADDYANALGGDARVEIVEDAVHWVWIDRPESGDVVTSFLLGSAGH